MKKYYVFYNHGGSPRARQFKGPKARIRWVGEYTLKYIGDRDYGIDLVVDGELVAVTEYVEFDTEGDSQ